MHPLTGPFSCFFVSSLPTLCYDTHVFDFLAIHVSVGQVKASRNTTDTSILETWVAVRAIRRRGLYFKAAINKLRLWRQRLLSMKFFGMGSGRSGEGSSFFGSGHDDDDDDDEALQQLRKHLAVLALWVAAIRSAPYFLSMWESHGYNHHSLTFPLPLISPSCSQPCLLQSSP